MRSDLIISSNSYVLGIDLHGTLLDRNWKIDFSNEKVLIPLLEKVRNYADIYICTGNDYTFIEKYVPVSLIDLMSGFILETGCLIDIQGEKRRLTDRNTLAMVKQLEKELENLKFSQVIYFGRRDSTVSMFTRNEREGNDPQDLFQQVSQWINNSGYEKNFQVTHSSVAVDIIPRDFNKYRGLDEIAGGREIISIADSRNDLAMIANSDYSFIPANAYDKLDRLLENRRIEPLNDSEVDFKQVVLKSNYSYTRGVIEIIDYLIKNILHEK